MKIATFNVNGVNSRLERLLEWLAESKPDVACLQELKSPDGNLPIDAIHGAGYGIVAFGQRSTGLFDLLNAGTYTLQIFFNKVASKQLFDITTTITANLASPTPVPAAGLLLLTAMGGLGGLGFWRKRGSNAA